MVESNEINNKNLQRESSGLSCIITAENFENDIFKLFLREEYTEIKDKKKIRIILTRSENKIIEWHRETYGTKAPEEIDFEKWKTKLLKNFNEEMTLLDLLQEKPKFNEKFYDYFKRMERNGKRIKQKEADILDIIRNNLKGRGYRLGELIAGERKFTEALYGKIKDWDYANEKREKAKKPFNKERKQEIQKDHKKPQEKTKTVNEITAEEIVNKNVKFYIKNKIFTAQFDSAAEENYITESIVKETNIEIWKYKEPKRRYTCLQEPFYITRFVILKFKYNGKEYEEKFNILPKRRDNHILIGRAFMEKQNENSVNEANTENREKSIDELIEKLCSNDNKEIVNFQCTIPTIPNKTVSGGTYMIPYAEEKKINEEIERLLRLGYIRPSKSSWLNRMRPVPKENGRYRITLNLIKLNQLVVLDQYSLPNMEEMLYKLKGQKYFSKIDLKEGFYQIPLKEEDRFKTAFRVKNRLYEWTRMPMGFKNSPAVFQRFMDGVLNEEMGKSCYVYVDDILIFGRNKSEHDEALKRILKLLIASGLTANKDKIELFKSKVKFLGHIVSSETIEPCINVKEGIENYPRPTNVTEVRKFHGIVNYYRKFIPSLSRIIDPIINLTRKEVEFNWDEKCEKAFQELKEILLSKLILKQPDFNRKFFLETDASLVGLGAILSQKEGENLYPVAYASRKTKPAEKNYSSSEREMLAALWGMEHFRYFLIGKEFELITDHSALQALNTHGEVKSARIQRWIERIQIFNFHVTYKKGSEMNHVDALSRCIPKENETCNQINELEGKLKEKILNTHESLVHRGAQAVYEKLKDEAVEGVTKKQCIDVLKDCITCKLYNPIRIKGMRHVQAYEVGEMVAIDILGPYEESYIIVGIDYFSRYAFAKIIPERSSVHVLEFLKTINQKVKIRKIIADGARENKGEIIKKWCKEEEINCHYTSPHHHQSNGRVERLNRTIQEGLNKQAEHLPLSERLTKTIEAYNNIKHSAIKMTPQDALDPEKKRKSRKTNMII